MEYRIMLVENNRIMLERLSSVIRANKEFDLVARYQEAEDALGQGKVFDPTYILLDIEKDGNMAYLPSFVQAFPRAGIICTSSSWNPENSSHLVSVGAKGYILKPFSAEDLLEAIKTFGQSGLAVDSDVFAFFSPKGKSGKTTLIANLALSLARKSDEQVGIIDADLQFGDMAVFFNLASKSTIVEAVRDVKFLSPVTLKSYFVPVNDKVSVLCGTARPDYAEMVSAKQFRLMLSMAKSIFRYILIDLSPGFGPIQIEAAERSDLTFLVAMINHGFELQHMNRALEIFQDWPDYKERVKMLFTRVSPCDDSSRIKLEDQLGYPVEGIIPNEYVLVSTAANNGRMAVDFKPTSPLTQSIDKLADRIRGKKRLRYDKP